MSAHAGVAVILFVSLISGGQPTSQQPRPNFSGRWVLETPAKESAGASPVEVVTHEGDKLTVGHPPGTHAVVYLIDGSEHRTTSFGADVRSTATWEDSKLIIVRSVSRQGGPTQRTKQVWSVDDAGKLTIEWSTPGSSEEKPTRRTYSKK
jgi:hypothetical protein